MCFLIIWTTLLYFWPASRFNTLGRPHLFLTFIRTYIIVPVILHLVFSLSYIGCTFLMFCDVCWQPWSDVARRRFFRLVSDKHLFAQICGVDQVCRLNSSYIIFLHNGVMTKLALVCITQICRTVAFLFFFKTDSTDIPH